MTSALQALSAALRLDTPRRVRWRRAAGWPALAGVLMLAAAAMLHTVVTPGLAADAAQARDAIAQAMRRADAARPPARTLPAFDALALASGERERFIAAFPPAAERHAHLAALLAEARRAGFTQQRAETRWLPQAVMSRVELTLRVDGDYPRLRGFISNALQRDAALSLDGLRLQRSDPASAALTAEMRWSLHLRTEEATP